MIDGVECGLLIVVESKDVTVLRVLALDVVDVEMDAEATSLAPNTPFLTIAPIVDFK